MEAHILKIWCLVNFLRPRVSLFSCRSLGADPVVGRPHEGELSVPHFARFQVRGLWGHLHVLSRKASATLSQNYQEVPAEPDMQYEVWIGQTLRLQTSYGTEFLKPLKNSDSKVEKGRTKAFQHCVCQSSPENNQQDTYAHAHIHTHTHTHTQMCVYVCVERERLILIYWLMCS